MNSVTKVTETMRNTVRLVQEKRREHAEKLYSNGKCQKSRDPSPNPEEEKRRLFSSFNEYKFLICLVCLSSAIVFCKVPIVYKNVFQRAFSLSKVEFSKPLNIFMSGSTAVFSATWSAFIELSWLFVPAIVGIVTTLFTWQIIYRNSRIPGVDPPSPFFQKFEERIQRLSIPSSCMFAIVMGIAVFLTLLILEVIPLWSLD